MAVSRWRQGRNEPDRGVLIIVLRFVLMFLLPVCLAVTARASECERLSEVCLSMGHPPRFISGYPVHRDCWKYEAPLHLPVRRPGHQRMR